MAGCIAGGAWPHHSQRAGSALGRVWYVIGVAANLALSYGGANAAGSFQADMLDHAYAAIVALNQRFSFFEFKLAFDGELCATSAHPKKQSLTSFFFM